MKKNEEEANSERLKSFETLRHELQAQRLKMNELLNNERQELCNEIVHKTQHEVFEIVQKTLSDMASINVEAGIAEVFIQKILALSDDKIKLLQSALQASSFTAHIHSAFTISKEQGQGIKSAISSVTKKETSITFETDPSLVCGIELIADGYKLSWNITDYINSMEKNIT
jgi:F-type H+-transporting ATPase subunit b